jgi:hypothetical protein
VVNAFTNGSALAGLFADALAAAWALILDEVHYLVRDKGYAVAASSGAEHELDYYTEWPSWYVPRAKRPYWESW